MGNKKAALAWVMALKASGSTNMLRALKAAQAKFSDYDSMNVLGDGAASDCKLKSCLGFCPKPKCEKPVHTTLFMPATSESKSRQVRDQLKLIAAETGGKFSEPYPPTTASRCSKEFPATRNTMLGTVKSTKEYEM